MPATLYIYVPLHFYCSLYIDPKSIYTKCKKKTIKTNVTLIYHAIAIYMPATNIPLKCHTYAIYAYYFMFRYQTTMSVYVPHVKLQQ